MLNSWAEMPANIEFMEPLLSAMLVELKENWKLDMGRLMGPTFFNGFV